MKQNWFIVLRDRELQASIYVDRKERASAPLSIYNDVACDMCIVLDRVAVQGSEPCLVRCLRSATLHPPQLSTYVPAAEAN